MKKKNFQYNLDNISVMLRHSITLLISTAKHMHDRNQLLLIPLTIWSGLEQSFLGAQFTKVKTLLNISITCCFRLGFCFLHIQCKIYWFNINCLWYLWFTR
jgi:hypothetical protein